MRTFLNYFELLCISIEHNVLDEWLCKEYTRSILLMRWKAAEPLVKRIRDVHGNALIYEYFEEVANRWQRAPLKDGRHVLQKVWHELLMIVYTK